MSFDHPISRRSFLRRGALLSAALASAPGLSLFARPGDADAAIMGIGKELRDVLNQETVNRILQEALARGGDFADVFAEQRFRTYIVLDDGKFDSVTYGYPRGASVRVAYRNRTGFAFTETIEYSSLLDAARVASAVVENQGRTSPVDVTPRMLAPSFAIDRPVPLESEGLKFDLVQRMDAAARAVDPRIVAVHVEYRDEVRDVLMGTSDGGYFMDRQYLVSITATPTARQGSERRGASASAGGRVGADYFNHVSVDDAARSAARVAIQLLDAGPAPAGPLPVVIAPGWGGVLIHESLGHALEGDGIRRGTSSAALACSRTRCGVPGVRLDPPSVGAPRIARRLAYGPF